METLYNGREAEFEPENCPNRGKLVFWGRELDGQHGDKQTLYCKLCGVSVRREPYPEEARFHPA